VKENKGFAVGGAILLGVVLLVAAFSLGVYVGRYGLTREGLSYSGPGMGAAPVGAGQAPGGQQPGQVPGNQPPGQVPGNPGQAPGSGAGQIPGGQPPNQGPSSQGPLPNAPQALPSGLDTPPRLIGRLIAISPDGLDLATPDGPRPVLLTADTVIEDGEGGALALSDLAPGDVVGIYGELSGGGAGRTLTATRVVILPPQPQP